MRKQSFSRARLRSMERMLADPRVEMDSRVGRVCSLALWVDCIRMRRATALQTCVCLVLAFCLAPFQHVHVDHDRGILVHAHPYAQSRSHENSGGARIDDVDDHASVKSLDTFTLAFAPRIVPFVLAEGSVLEPVSLTALEPIDIVEACGHDPPDVDLSIPRGPPA